MKKTLRLIINILLVAVLLFGLAKLAISIYDGRRSRADYDMALQLAAGNTAEEEASSQPEGESPEAEEKAGSLSPEIPDDPLIQELLSIDLDALKEENEDVIGWIHIPDTEINYPLLHWTDNEFYLTHTWTQASNPSGAIFMDCQNDPDFSGFNTIIYGHNMNNGQMFAPLHQYRRPDYRESHPYVYIVNEDGVLRYDVFASQLVKTDSIIYGLGIESDQSKEIFIRFATDYAIYETEIKPSVDDRILTLSTCTGGSHARRCVVLCVLNEENSYKRPD